MQRISNTVVGLTILDSFILTGGLISSVSLFLFLFNFFFNFFYVYAVQLVTAIVTYFSVILESA